MAIIVNDDGTMRVGSKTYSNKTKKTNTTQKTTTTKNKSEKKDKKWYEEYINLDRIKQIDSIKDYYDFQTATSNDILGNAFQGVFQGAEGLSDFARNRYADLADKYAKGADFIGWDTAANKLTKSATKARENALVNDTQDMIDSWEHIISGDLAGKKKTEDLTAYEDIHKNSALGDSGREMVQSISLNMTNAALNTASGGTLGIPLIAASAAGNAEQEALQKGATIDEARTYGILMGGIEAGTEMLAGGMGKISEGIGFGKGALDDQIIKRFNKAVKNTMLDKTFIKNLTSFGIKALGEGGEEFLAGLGGAFAQKLTYMKDEDLTKLIEDQDLLKSFIMGTLSSVVMQAPSTVTSTVQGRDVNTGLTQAQQEYVNEIAEQRLEEAQKRNNKLNGYQQTKIEDRALEDYQKGRLFDSSKLPLSDDVKKMDLQQSAYKYGINPNSEAVVNIKTMTENRGINARFDETLTTQNAAWSRKGSNREILINPNADMNMVLEEIAIHELTHDLMSSSNSNQEISRQNVLDYVSNLDNYEQLKKDYTNRYKEQIKGMSKAKAEAYINEEILADTLGKNIGSQEYIRKLVDSEPKFSKMLYNAVVDIANSLANKKGVKHEKLYWENVKNSFEDAYNMEWVGKGKKSDTKYLIGGIESVENLKRSQDIKDKKLAASLEKYYNKAIDLEKQGFSNEEIMKRTRWFKDKNNTWKYEFSDSEMNLKEDLDDVKIGRKYTINELFNHDMLTALYPGLNKYRIIFEKMGKKINGTHNIEEKLIRINSSALDYNNLSSRDSSIAKYLKMNNYEYSKTKIEGTLLHELQHAIQEIEKFETGNSSAIFRKAYYESLGEIEANDTKMRYILEKAGMLDRAKTKPESAKTNPTHKDLFNRSNLEYYLNKRSEIRKKLDDLYDKYPTQIDKIMEKAYNLFNKEGLSNEEIDLLVKEYQKEVEEKDSKNDLQNILRRRPTVEGTSDSSFSLEQGLENQASNLVEEDIQTRNAMLDNFKSYLEEYDITNPTQEDIDNSLIDLLGYDNDMTPAETLKYEKQYKEVVNEYLRELENSSSKNKYAGRFADGTEEQLQRAEENLKYNIKYLEEQVKAQEKMNKISRNDFEERLKINKESLEEVKLQYEELQNEFKRRSNNSDIRYSLTDNQGRELTKEQQEYFKDSKVRDENGNLLTMYHGSPNDFTVFDRSKSKASGLYGRGLYFTSDKNMASGLYEKGGKTYEVYLNSTNPLKLNQNNITKEQFKKFVEAVAKNEDYSIENYGTYDANEITNMVYGKGDFEAIQDINATAIGDMVEAVELFNEVNGTDYDGIEAKDQFVVFNSNQIKNVDNQNPTEDADIRYSLSDSQEERITKLKEEYESWDKARDVVFDERDALRKELNELIRSENYKTANSKFMEMIKSGLSPDEISKTPEYQLMAEEEKIRKKLKEYDEDIKVMTEDMTRISEMIENEEKSHRNPKDAIKQAKEFFGTTNDFREAGYLLQDGTLLDFSGRTQGSNTYGRRILDHREINEIGYDMDEFIELGNIRMKPEASGFELSKPLTKEQKSMLRDYLETLDDDIMVDITKDGHVLYDSATFKKGTSASKIFNDINYYFENGKFPEQSKYAEFRYSLSKPNETFEDFANKNFNPKGTKTRLGDIKLPGLQNAVQDEVVTQTQQALLPIANELKELNNNIKKVLNPNEISQLRPEDANTTPLLPGINRNKVGDGKSKFFDNINNKVNMLSDEQKTPILNEEDVKYYDKVTNKDSLDEAFARLQENGASESLRWFNNKSENATATDVAEGWILLKQYADSGNTEGMVEVAKKMREIGTKAGQTVQAFNILSRLTPEGMVKYAQSELMEAYDQMVKNKTTKWIEENRGKFELQPNEVQFIMDTMKEVSTMRDGYDKKFKLAQIQKLMTDKLPPAKGAGIKAWMRISMLFNPKTQVRNVAGNALIAPINAFGDLFASGADKLISKKTGVRTTGNFNLKTYSKGMKKGLYESYNDFKHGVNTRNIQGNRFELTEGKSFKDTNAIGKALNRVDGILSFMLDAGDRGFYEASFVNSINNQLVLNNTTEVTQDMIDIATQEALSRTWQDNNKYTNFVLGIRNGLNTIFPSVGNYGLGDILIPFAKTPANLTKAIVDYSPVGLVSTITKGIQLNRSLTNGQYNAQLQHEFVQNLGKTVAGTMLYVAGLALAKAGVTTGESDEDKDTANFLKNTLGVNSYSIQIGDMSFTYDWAQPLAAPLAITANLVNKQKEEASLLENITSTLDTAGNILLDQSFMESISTVLNNQEGIATGIQEAILDLPSRAVPTLFKQIVDITDGTQRQTFVKGKPIQSAVNSVIAKIPGLSYTLDASVDTLGRDIEKYGGKNNLFNVFLNPANVNTENISESAQEIYDVYKQTGESSVMPRVAPYTITIDGEKINLSTADRTEYQRISGKIIEDNVQNLMNTSAYTNMSDTKKAEVISNIVNYSYNVAQKELFGKELSDSYENAYEYSQIGDVSDYYTFKESIDDTNADTKRISIRDYLVDSYLNDEQIAYLYGAYYSSENELNYVRNAKISMKEFIKFDSEEFTSDYNNKGNAITNSRRNKMINFVNGLNLSLAQKAMLIKTEYSSYDRYDSQIFNYVNGLQDTAYNKMVLLKKAGFDDYDNEIIEHVNSQNISKAEKEKILKDMGFKVRNGRVYS